jgi:ADP-heptose:LPS heptosyltransferase/glycosyltransferase involved in cell wall biosynthesis
MSPIVTIIMPTYNRAYILEKSIRSVLNQSFKDFEFIVVDDCSSDNTAELIASIQREDARLKYIKAEAKRGAPHARNIGIAAAQGTLIAFQDSDVEWFPQKLERQVNLLRSCPDQVGVVYTGFYKVYSDRKVYIPRGPVSKLEGHILPRLLWGNFVDTPSSLVRKECFLKSGTFDESLPRLQDWDLFIRIAQNYEFKLINEALYNSDNLKDSISSNPDSLLKARQIIIKKYALLFKKSGAVPYLGTMVRANIKPYADIIQSIGGFKLKATKLADLVVGGLLASLAKPAAPPGPINSPQSILVIRPGGIGDAIFLLPILRTIRANRPGLRLDVLCEKRNAAIFRDQKGLCDTVLCYDNLSQLLSLRTKSYDIAVDTEQWHYLSALVAHSLNAVHTTGFATRDLRTKLFSTAVSYGSNSSELDNFKALFLPLFPEVKDVKTIKNSFIIDPQTQSIHPQTMGPYITLFLGASIPLRRLELSQCRQIITAAFKMNTSVILLGGGDVRAQGEAVEKDLADKRVVNFTGKVSLLQTAQLIKNSQFFIGPDSGIMHLACALGVPVKAIFGPGNVKKWGPPEGEGNKIISLYVECSPCTHFGYTIPTCHSSFHCMKKLTFDEVSIT